MGLQRLAFDWNFDFITQTVYVRPVCLSLAILDPDGTGRDGTTRTPTVALPFHVRRIIEATRAGTELFGVFSLYLKY